MNINLLNDKSFLKGNIVTNGLNIPEGYDKVDAMNLGLSDGGTWYIPEVAAGLEQNDVAINLDINGGVVDVAESDRTILVKKLDGEGGTLLAVSDSETKHPTAILRLNPTKET